MKAKGWFSIAAALALITSYILPRRNSAQLLTLMMESYSIMIKTAVGAVEQRDPRAIEMVLSMGPEDLATFYSHLTEKDLEWLNEQLRGTDNA